MGAGGECEAAITARKSCGWDNFRECDELLNSIRFPLRQKFAV